MKYIMTLMAAMILCLAPLSARANKEFDVNDKVQKLKVALGLNQQQEAETKTIMEDYKKSVEQAGDAKEERLKNVLSAEQFDQWGKMKKEMKKDYDDKD